MKSTSCHFQQPSSSLMQCPINPINLIQMPNLSQIDQTNFFTISPVKDQEPIYIVMLQRRCEMLKIKKRMSFRWPKNGEAEIAKFQAHLEKLFFQISSYRTWAWTWRGEEETLQHFTLLIILG
jgi:hypothetical protein